MAPSVEVLLAKPFVAVSRIEETAVSLELHHTGDPGDMAEIRALVERSEQQARRLAGVDRRLARKRQLAAA